MKTYFLLLAFCALNAAAQTTEPNLKWGKPTDDELQMTEYAADKEAKAGARTCWYSRRFKQKQEPF